MASSSGQPRLFYFSKRAINLCPFAKLQMQDYKPLDNLKVAASEMNNPEMKIKFHALEISMRLL